MKVLLFMPFAFAAGAEGFALFVPYMLVLLAGLHLVRARRQYGKLFRAVPSRPMFDAMPDAQPAL